ncbi:hypothetical protein BDV95DRAFT_594055 [Massariosphaeria phaeospora]|uniref:Uncharacterized protein n=1 Tax=Massariosphaeria phaeospora TaxID=100035 RepID=A0A7C8MAA3_9PLEO|nr:hypothetical protein BDV95DRAFT_594055 [Massariosphaeria phaeospora]
METHATSDRSTATNTTASRSPPPMHTQTASPNPPPLHNTTTTFTAYAQSTSPPKRRPKRQPTQPFNPQVTPSRSKLQTSRANVASPPVQDPNILDMLSSSIQGSSSTALTPASDEARTAIARMLARDLAHDRHTQISYYALPSPSPRSDTIPLSRRDDSIYDSDPRYGSRNDTTPRRSHRVILRHVPPPPDSELGLESSGETVRMEQWERNGGRWCQVDFDAWKW